MYLRYDDAIEHLRRAIEERGPDWVYPFAWRNDNGVCKYALADGSAGCVVGKVFEQMGASVGDLVGYYGPVRLAGEIVGIEMDDQAVLLLMGVQAAQDDSNPWGKAFEIGVSTSAYH